MHSPRVSSPRNDLEKQSSIGEKEETTPLLKKKSYVEKFQKWWRRDVSSIFKLTCANAFRVALWATLISAVPLSSQRGHQILERYNISVAEVLSTFLFVVMPTVGGSIRESLYTLIGNLISFAYIMALYAFFPNGGHWGTNPVGFWVGSSSAMLYIVIILWLNLAEQTQLFALMMHVYYIMEFLRPVGFTPPHYLAPSPAHAFVFVLTGVTLAILCPLLPIPETSIHRTRNAIRATSQDFAKLSKEVVLYYSGTEGSNEIASMKGELKIIKKHLRNIETSKSFFECFGFGPAGRSRFFTTKMIELFGLLVRRWDNLMHVIRHEEWDVRHQQIMDVEMRQLLSQIMDDFQSIIDVVTRTTDDGTIDETEKVKVGVHISNMRDNITKLSCVWVQKRQEVTDKTVSEHLSGETIFFHTVCLTCRKMAECAEELISHDHSQALTAAAREWVGSVFDRSELFNASHLLWVTRNATSVILAFWIGFFGFRTGCGVVAKNPDASCFIFPYDANIAAMVVLLISKFDGSVVNASVDRMIAMVLANFVALAGHVLFGWCSWSGRILTGMMVFTLVFFGMYNSFLGGSQGLLGRRVAATGAAGLLIPCSNDFLTESHYIQSYNQIISTIVGIAVMLLIDCTLVWKGPAQTMKSMMYEAMDMYKQTLTQYLHGNVKTEDFIEKIRALRHLLDEAEDLIPAASQEFVFWQVPFRRRLAIEASHGFINLCNISINLGFAMMRGKLHGQGLYEIVESCPGFDKFRTELIRALDLTVEVTEFVLRHKTRKELPKSFLKRHHSKCDEYLEEFVRGLNEKIKEEIGAKIHSSGSVTSFEDDITLENRFSTLSSIMVTMFYQISNELRKVREDVIHFKVSFSGQ